MVYVVSVFTEFPAPIAAIVDVDRLEFEYFIIYELLGLNLRSPIF